MSLKILNTFLDFWGVWSTILTVLDRASSLGCSSSQAWETLDVLRLLVQQALDSLSHGFLEMRQVDRWIHFSLPHSRLPSAATGSPGGQLAGSLDLHSLTLAVSSGLPSAVPGVRQASG